MAVTVNEEIAEPVVLPTDDDRLAAALAELDSKLTAWSGAIAHAQSSVIHLLSNQKDHTAPAPPAKIHVIAETPFHPTGKPATPTPDAVVTDKPAAVSTTDANPQEDEALLATLDPEVRKKVQILRRLSGNSKSVRELVEKHNLTAGTPAPPPPENILEEMIAMAQTKETTTQPPAVDVGQIETMGKDVLGAVQSLRELLDARAASLEACRKAVEEQSTLLIRDRDNFAQQQNELCDQFERQKAQLDEREVQCRQREEQQKGLADRETAIRGHEAQVKEQAETLQRQAQALEEQKARLAQDQQGLVQQRREAAAEQEELQKREAELSKVATTLEQRREELDRQESQIAVFKKEWESRMKEWSATKASLSGLQSELQQELSKVASEKPETLANKEMLQNSQVKSSLERFQKLCRDAKRRAIGAEGK